MDQAKRQFSPRQVMNSGDFEFFHNTDTRPIDVEYHSHDFYEIYFFLSGKVSYVIEGKTYHLRSGDILLTNNRELHKPLVGDGRTYDRFVVWIQPAYLRSLSEKGADLSLCFEASSKRHYNLLRPNSETLQSVRRLLDKLEDVSDQEIFGKSILCKAYLMELLVSINMAFFRADNEAEPDIEYNVKISEMLRYINENLTGDLSLDTLSQKFYVSKFHLSRQFKQYVGLTLHQYIMKKRLIAAKLLLLDGASVSAAYAGSGFGDFSNFLKVFKQEFGTSPKKFTEQARQVSL